MKDEKQKALPAAEPLEEAVIGALMMDEAAIYTISSLLKPQHISNEKNRLIYEAILSLYKRAAKIDLLTVAEECKKLGTLEKIGGPYEIVQITNRVASAANIEAHALIILEKWMRREVIYSSYRAINEAYDGAEDVFELINKHELAVEGIKAATLIGSAQDNSLILSNLTEQIERNKKRGGLGSPVFGVNVLDNLIKGGEEDDFIIVAGRPSMGKSSLINSAIKYHVLNKIPALFWSCEMTNTNTVARAIAAITDIAYNRIMMGQLSGPEEAQYLEACSLIAEAPVFFEELTGITALEFKSKVITLKKREGIKAAYLDRIGLLNDMPNSSKLSTTDKIGLSSKCLRQLALQAKLPIVALNQLSREVEKRPLKIPILSDLRNSGNLEQDATKVIFVYRPEYYNILQDEEGDSTAGKVYFIVAKNRNAKTDTVKASFKGECMYFLDEEEEFNELPDYNPNITLESRREQDEIPF